MKVCIHRRDLVRVRVSAALLEFAGLADGERLVVGKNVSWCLEALVGSERPN